MTEYFDLWKLVAGLGLFLLGMNHLEEALKKLAGKRFRGFLRQSTDKPVSSVVGGIVATTILQSSSLVGLIVLAFVGAGIIPLVNAIGIVIGANLGTTFTGWIVTTLGFKFELSAFIYPMLGVGGLSYGLAKGQWKFVSQLILGFALLLMGLDFMKDSVAAVTEHVDINVLRGYPLIVYLLVGVLFTAIIQSSSAAMMLTLSALYADIIPLPAAAALVIGADLGTTSTVLLGSLQGAVAKRRLAMAHVLFNLSVDVVAFIALFPLLALIASLHIEDPLYALVAFHSSFNLFGLLLFIPLIPRFSRFLERWIKDDEEGLKQYIHTVPVGVTDAAIEALVRESRHLIFLVAYLNMRFLHIEPLRDSSTTRPFRLPGILVSSSKLEHYMAIKELEGEVVNYALKIPLSEANDELDKEKLDHYTDQVDGILKAVRSAVYSAKAMKDIEQNIETFYREESDKLLAYYEPLKDASKKMYLQILGLIENAGDYRHEVMEEELASMKQLSQEYHHEFANEIYQGMSQLGLSPYTLSTLLNVNKEIQTSKLALLKALRKLSSVSTLKAY